MSRRKLALVIVHAGISKLKAKWPNPYSSLPSVLHAVRLIHPILTRRGRRGTPQNQTRERRSGCPGLLLLQRKVLSWQRGHLRHGSLSGSSRGLGTTRLPARSGPLGFWGGRRTRRRRRGQRGSGCFGSSRAEAGCCQEVLRLDCIPKISGLST